MQKAAKPHATVSCMLRVTGEGANTCINLPVKLGQPPSPQLISTNTANTYHKSSDGCSRSLWKSVAFERIHGFQEWAPLLRLTAAERLPWQKRRPPLCPSDGLCDWGQAELGPGGLGLHSALVLSWRGPGCHRGIPAGALSGGPACTAAFLTSGKHGPADAFPPEHQDHRLARLEICTVWWRWAF